MKLKRGQKRCKSCKHINAARQRMCVKCGKTFQIKNRPIKNEIKDWVCDNLSNETCSKHNFYYIMFLGRIFFRKVYKIIINWYYI